MDSWTKGFVDLIQKTPLKQGIWITLYRNISALENIRKMPDNKRAYIFKTWKNRKKDIWHLIYLKHNIPIDTSS